MLREERLRRIADLMRENESLSMSKLSEMLGVSPITIRRDLTELHASGALHRIHGGAISVDRMSFKRHQVTFQEEKIRIARAIASMVANGETVLLDIGTTVFYVAQALRKHKNLLVLTNSINAAQALADSGNRVLLTGGLIQADYESLVGRFATDVIRQFHVDKLILGCGGITLDRGLVYFDVDEADVRRAMLEASRTIIVAADHSKFGQDLFEALAPLERVQAIVTDW